MIFDQIENATLYSGLNPLIEQAFKYIKSTDLESLKPGKHLIDGDNLFVISMQYETKDQTDCVLETHFKHIDIHYYISGSEYIGIASLNGQVPITESKDDDYAFYNSDYDLLPISAGKFAIFFPDDMHKTGITRNRIETIQKCVFKIKI